MENNGWIKIHRKILKWEWIDSPNTLSLFVHFLLSVNWEDGKWHGLTVKRGQRISTFRKMAKECGLTVREFRTSLERLKSTQEMASERHSGFSLFTVLKFNEYQTNDTENDTRTTHERHTNDTPYKNERIKELKKEEEEIQSTPKIQKIKFGEVVSFTQQEHDELVSLIGAERLNQLVEKMNDYCLASGKRYKNYSAAIRNWWRKDGVAPKKEVESLTPEQIRQRILNS